MTNCAFCFSNIIQWVLLVFTIPDMYSKQCFHWLSSLVKTCFTRGITDIFKMTDTKKVNREGQFTIFYNTAGGRRKLLSPHKMYYTKQGWGTQTFFPSQVSTELWSALKDFVCVNFHREITDMNINKVSSFVVLTMAEYQFQENFSRRAETKFHKTKGLSFVLQNYLFSVTLETA